MFTISFPLKTQINLVQTHDNNMDSNGQRYSYTCFPEMNWGEWGREHESAELEMLMWWIGCASSQFNILLTFNSHLSKYWGPSCPLRLHKGLPISQQHLQKNSKNLPLPLGVNMLPTFLPLLNIFYNLNLFLIRDERKTLLLITF